MLCWSEGLRQLVLTALRTQISLDAMMQLVVDWLQLLLLELAYRNNASALSPGN